MGRVAHARPDLTRTLTMIEPVYYHLIADVRPDAVAEESASMTEVNKAIAERRFRDGGPRVYGGPGASPANSTVSRNPLRSPWPARSNSSAKIFR